MLTNRFNSNNINLDSNNGDIKSILYRNFTGKPDQFNPKGQMGNFTLVLDEDKGRELEAAGLNIKWKDTPDGDKEPRLKVFVRYENFPPHVYRVINGNIKELDADSVALLDQDDIQDVDLVISPYSYEFNGRKGVKAYLSKGYFTIVEDPYMNKHKDENSDDELPFQ